ncbi:hypothetical protein RLEG12_14655 [Rhizobium leguminosarum bv. trifolii CB782]|nr:hypothetical protein RLEG12_14655 [Rhizobium leguminosarum bv. trifolii CB782]
MRPHARLDPQQLKAQHDEDWDAQEKQSGVDALCKPYAGETGQVPT